MTTILRYRLYREHKYVYAVFNDILTKAAKMNFVNEQDFNDLETQVNNLTLLLDSHANYEETRIHRILKQHGNHVSEVAEAEHLKQRHFSKVFAERMTDGKEAATVERRQHIGYLAYLDLRDFFADNLHHFAYEERVIMPALQACVDDETIREIDRQSYRAMNPEQVIHMLKVLFPHMNSEDRFTFLKDIHDCEPEKLSVAWPSIIQLLEVSEQETFAMRLNITPATLKVLSSEEV